MFRYVIAICTLLPATGLSAADETTPVRLARAELAVAQADKDLAVAEAALATAEAKSELTVRIAKLSREYATAKARLDATARTDTNYIKYKLVVHQQKTNLAEITETGTKRLPLLQRMWDARLALANAKLSLAKLRLAITLNAHAKNGGN